MEVIMAKDLGRAKFVKKAREERAWPQRQLAEIAGVTLRTVQRVEKDGSASFETLMGLASAFEIDVKELSPSSNSKKVTRPEKAVYQLPRLATGRNLTDVIKNSDEYEIVHDGANHLKTVEFMRRVLISLKQKMIQWKESSSDEQIKLEFELSEAIQEMEKFGFYLFGTQRVIQKISGSETNDIKMVTLFMTYANSPKIIKDKKMNMVVPSVLSEVQRVVR